MKIARFGDDTWAGSYVFGNALMEDTWASARPVLGAQAGGAGGVFDFHGSTSSPPVPLVARKKFALTAATSSAIEDALDTLRAWTIVKSNSRLTDLSRLWFLDRDGSTRYWMQAKCTKLNASESYRERGRWMKVVDVEFYCQEGLWYGESEQGYNSGLVTGELIDSITNAGNYLALVRILVEVDATSPAAMTNCILINDLNGADWTFAGTVAIGDKLIVNANDYTVTNNLVAAYSDLTIGTGQLAWWYLNEVVSNQFRATPTPLTVKHHVSAEWHNTYVF